MTKIIFLGTPEFALPILEKLINSEYKPAAVFCAPDKPVGRQQTLTPPPVKVLAQKYGLLVYQPANKKELTEQIAELKPGLILSAAYGIIVPQEVLDAPKFSCLNIHPSLLPKYRGASPIQTAILNGDTESGTTIFKMDAKMDTGTIIAKETFPLSSQKLTTPELSKKLAELSAGLLLNILPDWLAGKIKPEVQNEALASYSRIIAKEDGQINWQKTAKEIEQQIRAFFPWPGSFSGQPKIKILEAEASEKKYNKQIGEVFLTETNALAIQAGSGALIVKKLQAEGGKALLAEDFLRGHANIIGQILK
ncbi:MAG TPA: methionyl-tRNA formyltransferase [Candidatus Portnoybacteria bacterium]|nr:methionyl-tRNA formyltransferase [Candidatus Portnoybacteria bacterium]